VSLQRGASREDYGDLRYLEEQVQVRSSDMAQSTCFPHALIR